MQAGRVAEGLEQPRRALGLMERSLGPHAPELAMPLHDMALAVRLSLARALRARGGGPQRAQKLAESALGEAGEAQQDLRETIERWLREPGARKEPE